MEDGNLVRAPVIFYASVQDGTANATLDELTIKFGTEVKKILVGGAKNQGASRSYVNYAYGGESLEEIYGRES